MNGSIIKKIDEMIDGSYEALVQDTVKYVNIKSVCEIAADPKDAIPGAPFGVGVREMLDEFLKDAEHDGLFTTDHGVGVVSAAMKPGAADLGIWLHGDVVPEGDGWNFEPYNATEYKGCVIGRGATDNKGQLAAVLNLFRIFKAAGCRLKYNPAIYLGSNEEVGMKDLKGMDGNPDARGFINVCTPPRLSLVPDSGFPVGYGGKGSVNVVLRGKTPLEGFTFVAGQPDSPGSATAVFNTLSVPDELVGCDVSKVDGVSRIHTYSPPRHGANPDPNGNMITALSCALIDAGLVSGDSERTVRFFRDVSHMVYGELFGIETSHGVMGKLTVFTKCISCTDGYPEITLNIRYPLGITYDRMVERIGAYASTVGFDITCSTHTTAPYMLDPDSEVVEILTNASREVTGEDKKPYTLSGGTYAHHLPNAYVFGMNGNLPPDDFPKGRGGAHGVDEAVSIERLKRAMKIYARALIALDSIEW